MGEETSGLEELVWQQFIKPELRRKGFKVRERGIPLILPKGIFPPADMKKQILTSGTSISRLVWNELLEGRGINYDGVEGRHSKSNDSRLTADVISRLVGEVRLSVPVVSANMECVTDKGLALFLAQRGEAGVMHQFFRNPEEQAEHVSYVKQAKVQQPITIDRVTLGQTLDESGRYVVGAAIGINNGAYKRAGLLVEAGVDFLVIDIALGYNPNLINLLSKVKSDYKGVPVIVGNLTEADAAYELCEAGADGLKVLIAGGDPCITGSVTGFGSRRSALTAIVRTKAVAAKYNVTVIADGGIKNTGQTAQALAAGADAVMYGYRFAQCPESANFGSERRLPEDEKPDKPQTILYWGSASDRANQLLGHGRSNIAEGTVKRIPVNREGAQQVVLDDRVGLGSAFSYAGASDVSEFRSKSRWILAG